MLVRADAIEKYGLKMPYVNLPPPTRFGVRLVVAIVWEETDPEIAGAVEM